MSVVDKSTEPPPPHRWWGHPIITHGERDLIVKALSELEARTMEKREPTCCSEHNEGWNVRLERIRALLARFSKS